jgi:hypothetical protein
MPRVADETEVLDALAPSASPPQHCEHNQGRGKPGGEDIAKGAKWLIWGKRVRLRVQSQQTPSDTACLERASGTKPIRDINLQSFHNVCATLSCPLGKPHQSFFLFHAAVVYEKLGNEKRLLGVM